MSEPGGRETAARAVRRFFGMVLMVAGMLVALAGGLCTIALGGSSLSQGLANAGIGIVFMLAIGAIPVSIGFGMIKAGEGLYRNNAPRP